VVEGAVIGLIGSVLLITLWLFLAVQTWRLILPILATLGLGLMLTLLFAAVAVGTLNLISVGFGILFVGIAVDFAIQFSVRYRERRFEFPDPAEAMRQNAVRTGDQILVAAVATSAGFLGFVPTDFSGVAELGLIAGVRCCDVRWFSWLRADGFFRRRRARPHRRHRHADRVPLHVGVPAGDHHAVSPAW
jgi:predicted RND superfamily exporter protein